MGWRWVFNLGGGEMSKYPLCPAGCGLKFVDKEHAEKHADLCHPGWRDPKPKLCKGWRTPWGFIDFSVPVSYEKACEAAKNIQEKYGSK